MDDQTEKQMNEEIMEIVNEATDYAENAPFASEDTLSNYVYAGK